MSNSKREFRTDNGQGGFIKSIYRDDAPRVDAEQELARLAPEDDGPLAAALKVAADRARRDSIGGLPIGARTVSGEEIRDLVARAGMAPSPARPALADISGAFNAGSDALAEAHKIAAERAYQDSLGGPPKGAKTRG